LVSIRVLVFFQLRGAVQVAARRPDEASRAVPRVESWEDESDTGQRRVWRRPIRDLVRGLACIVLLHVFVV